MRPTSVVPAPDEDPLASRDCESSATEPRALRGGPDPSPQRRRRRRPTAPLRQRVLVWTLFVVVMLVRLSSAVYLVMLAALHLFLGPLFGVYAERRFTLWAPEFSGVAFLLLALANLGPPLASLKRGLRRWCCRRWRRRRRSSPEGLPLSPPTTSVSALHAWSTPLGSRVASAATNDDTAASSAAPLSPPRRRSVLVKQWRSVKRLGDQYFGVRGTYFAELLVTAEIIEISSQTINLFDIASSGVGRAGIVAFAAILSCNAVVTPALLLSDKLQINRDLTIVCDTVFDFAVAVVWPLSLVGAFGAQVYACEGVIGNQHILVDSMSLLQMIMVDSPLELMIKLIPFLSAHILLMELWEAMLDEHKSVFLRASQDIGDASAPSAERPRGGARPEVRAPFWLRLLGTGLGVVYACTILSIAVVRTEDRCGDEPMCTKQSYSFSSSACECTILDAKCDTEGPLDPFGLEAVANLANRQRSSLRALGLDHCALEETPWSLPDLDELWFLDANNNSLASHTGVGDLSSLPHLFIVALNHNNLTDVPVFSETGEILSLQLGWNRIRDPRQDIRDLRNLVSFYVQGNDLSQGLPCAYGSVKLVRLYASEASLPALPECLGDGWAASLEDASLGANNLTGLPSALRESSVLINLKLEENPVCAPSVSLEARVAALGGGPAALDGVCEGACDISCPQYLQEDSFCNEFLCDTAACGFDNGKCVGESQC